MSNYSFRAHAASDRRKWVVVTIAILLIAAVIVTGCLTDWFTNWNKYCLFGHDYGEDGKCSRCGKEKLDEVEKEPENDKNSAPGKDTAFTGGGQATVLQGNGIMLMATAVPISEPTAVQAPKYSWELSATVNELADNKAVDWLVEWVDPSSEFATGKLVSDYLTVTPSSDGALTATANMLQAFGEQIKVIVRARDTFNGTIEAECLFDYVQKVTAINFQMPAAGVIAPFSCTYSFESEPVYTVSCNPKVELYSISSGNKSMNLFYTPEFVALMRERFGGTVFYYNLTPLVVDKSNTIRVQTFDELRRGTPKGTCLIRSDIYPSNLSNPDLSQALTFMDSSFPGMSGILEENTYRNYTWENLFFVQRSSDSFDRLSSAFKIAYENFVRDGKASIYFTVTYSSTYEGKTYKSDRVNIPMKFDGSSLNIPVSQITVDSDHIYA